MQAMDYMYPHRFGQQVKYITTKIFCSMSPKTQFKLQNLCVIICISQQSRKCINIKKLKPFRIYQLAHTAHSAQVWRIFLPVYHRPSKTPRTFILMKNECLVTIFYEFIVRYVWTIFLY